MPTASPGRRNAAFGLLKPSALLLGLLVNLTAAANSFGPIRSGDSLWRIYDRVAADSNRPGWTIATLKLNAAAFNRACDPNSLKRGAVLTLPTGAQVGAIDPVRALQEFERQLGSKDDCSDWFKSLELPLAEAEVSLEATTPSESETTSNTPDSGSIQERSREEVRIAASSVEAPLETDIDSAEDATQATATAETGEPNQAESKTVTEPMDSAPVPQTDSSSISETAPSESEPTSEQLEPPAAPVTQPKELATSEPEQPTAVGTAAQAKIESPTTIPIAPEPPRVETPDPTTQQPLEETAGIAATEEAAPTDGPANPAAAPSNTETPPTLVEAEPTETSTPIVTPSAPPVSGSQPSTELPRAPASPPLLSSPATKGDLPASQEPATATSIAITPPTTVTPSPIDSLSELEGLIGWMTSLLPIADDPLATQNLIFFALIAALLVALIRLRRRIAAITGSADMLYRRKMLVAISIVVVFGQLLYAYLNVLSFQRSYLDSIQTQSLRLGDYLRQDIEYVLKLGIPLQKLIKIESSLAEILEATPEIEFLEIADLEHRVIYYADQRTMERVKDQRLSKTLHPEQEGRHLFAISQRESDLRIPISNPRSDEQVGYIEMRISTELIWETTREIVWDILTVILVSLLVTFEFLGFFVNRSFSDPLRRLIRQAHEAVYTGRRLERQELLTLSGIGRLLGQTNHWLKRIRPSADLAHRVGEERRQRIGELLQRQLIWVDELATRDTNDELQPRLRGLTVPLRRLQCLLDLEPAQHISRGRYIPYHYIRPFVFLFFIAYNLPVSFFPMFVRNFETPPWDLSQEMLIGLPISIFMFFFALSMLLSGRWLDRAGWYRPLVTGGAIFSVGFLLTAFATGYIEMVVYRSITAIGLGIGFMGFQQFVVTNTYARERNIGLASFLGAFFAGEIVGTVVGGMLAERLGYENIFLLSALAAVLSLLGIIIFLRANRDRQEDRRTQPELTLVEMVRSLSDREFLAVVIFQAIPAKIALVGFLMYFVPLYLSQLNTLQSDIGRIAMCYGLVLVVLGPLLSRWLAYPQMRKYHVLAGGLITGASMVGFAFASDVLMVLVMVAALGIAHALSLSSQASLIAETRLVKRLGLGSGMGIYRFWERVGNVAGPFLMAALIAWNGYQEAIVTLGVLIMISSVIYILLLIGISTTVDHQPPVVVSKA